MRADRADAVSQRPFDRAPIISQQEIGPLVTQDPSKGMEIGEADAVALAGNDRMQAQLHLAIDSLGGVSVAVPADHDMPEAWSERIGERREATLCTAQGEGGKGMKQLERTPRRDRPVLVTRAARCFQRGRGCH
jgi:hypothetical protein